MSVFYSLLFVTGIDFTGLRSAMKSTKMSLDKEIDIMYHKRHRIILLRLKHDCYDITSIYALDWLVTIPYILCRAGSTMSSHGPVLPSSKGNGVFDSAACFQCRAGSGFKPSPHGHVLSSKGNGVCDVINRADGAEPGPIY